MWIFRLLRSLFAVLLVIIVFVLSVSIARAVDYTETFDSSISNPGFWQAIRGTPIFGSDSGRQYAILQVPDHINPFHYLESVPFSSLKSDFSSVTMTLKFSTRASVQGAGYIFSDNVPKASDPLLFNTYMFYVWPKPDGTFHLFSSLCPESNSLCNVNSQLVNGVYAMPTDDAWHSITIRRYSSKYEWLVDGNLIFRTVETLRTVSSLGIGDPENTTGDQSWPQLFIDYIGIDSIPTPSSFPYLSQKDPAWGGKEYDSATSWAGLGKDGIDRWGCALTSVAMMLQKYEVKTPDGTNVDPDILNTWLKSQPDGYVGPGLLNWIAVTRYAHQSYLAGKSPTELEYLRQPGSTTPTLPAILGVSGHFVVGHNEDTTNWKINDPADQTKTTLAKTTTLTSINRFLPSHTDLTNMLFVTSPGVTATLKNALSEIIPIEWFDDYLTDDVDGGSGPTVRTGIVPKPADGIYRLIVDQPTGEHHDFSLFLYDEEASPSAQTFTLPDPVNYFDIQYASGSAEARTVTMVDLSAPPVPTLLSPEDGVHRRPEGLVLDWSDVTDPSGPVTYNYKSDWPGGSYGPVSTGTNSFIDAPGTPDQTYHWYVQACDSAGNCSEWSAPWSLTIDSVAPTVDLLFPTPGVSSNYFEAAFSEPVEPEEATSGANYFLSNWSGAGGSGDLADDANITYDPGTRTAHIVFTQPGWYISPEQLWGVQNIHDLAGNVISPNPYSEYSTPMTPPTLGSAPSSTPNPTNMLTQNWNWLAGSDIGSGIRGYSTRTYDVDGEHFLSDWLWLGQVLGTSTTLAEGRWRLDLMATDNAGNESAVLPSSTLTVDTTSPSTPTNLHFDNPSLQCGGYTNQKTVTVDWDDATDNGRVAGYEYNIDYPLPSGTGRGSWTTFFTTSSYRGSLNEGTHYLKIRTKDTAGNYSDWSDLCAITYDPVTPTLTSKTSFDGWYNTAQVSTFDYVDTNLADDYVPPTCTISTEGAAETCTTAPNVCDRAGNCNTTLALSNPAKIDLTKPLVSLSAWGTTINGAASDAGSGLDRVDLRIRKPDSTEYTITADGTTDWTYTMSEAPLGSYRVVAVAYDLAGNQSEEAGKEFVMSPTASSGTSPSVLGAATAPPSETPKARKVKPESPEPSVEPSPSYNPESTPAGEVLGADTEPVEKQNYWWWLLLLVPVVGIIAWIKRKK